MKNSLRFVLLLNMIYITIGSDRNKISMDAFTISFCILLLALIVSYKKEFE